MKGFSLIELSVVLVLMGLILAGVMVSQNLVENYKLRMVIKSFDSYRAAYNLFYDDYSYYPGDFPSASESWPSCTDGLFPCDGNGNKLVEFTYGSAGYSESYRFWQHLALSGYISGEYTGEGYAYPDSYAPDAVNPGVNSPITNFKDAAFAVANAASHDSIDPSVFPSNSSANLFFYSKVGPAGPGLNSVFMNKQARYIDTKLDDGMPDIGIVQAKTGFDAASECITDGVYVTEDEAVKCYLIMILD